MTVQAFHRNCNKINVVEKVVHGEDIKHTTILSFGQNQVSKKLPKWEISNGGAELQSMNSSAITRDHR